MRIAFLVMLLLLPGSNSWAVPLMMSHQGVLTDNAGNPVSDGNYSLTFALYDGPAAPSPLWVESQPAVAVTGGAFSVMLGSHVTLWLPFDRPFWLGIAVGGDPELTPRVALATSPYAYTALGIKLPYAASVATAEAVRITNTQAGGTAFRASASGGGFAGYFDGNTYMSGNLGVGITPTARLHIGGTPGTDGVRFPDGTLQTTAVVPPGVASNSTTTTFGLGTSGGSIIARTITLPGPGYVVAMGNTTTSVQHTNGTLTRVALSVSNAGPTTHDLSNRRFFQLSSVLPSGSGYSAEISVQDVFSFAAGGVQAFNLVANLDNGLGPANVVGGSLTLMYFPAAYGTVSVASGSDE